MEQVSSSNAEKPYNAAPLNEGAYLLSLEPELDQQQVLIKCSALMQALFSRRVCLTDTQIIESRALDHLFVDNYSELTKEVRQVENDLPPIFGTCTRNNLGANLLAALDSMLIPKPPYNFPAYFTRLTQEQNQSLRAGYAQLRTLEERREAFFKLAGKRVKLSLQQAEEYFRHPQAVVARTEPPRLYHDVGDKLDALKAAGKYLNWKEIDHTIYHALQGEIAAHPDLQSRERLHLAIYGGDIQRFRHFHGDRFESSDEAEEVAAARLDWRYLVNALYNYDLAGRYRSCPVFGADWYEPPPRLTLPEDQWAIDKTVEHEEFRIESAVYQDVLTIPFVASVRREAEFWTSITDMEAAQESGDTKKCVQAIKHHVQMVSEHFKKYLIDSGHRTRVEEQTVRVMMGPLAYKAFGAALLVDAALAFLFHTPPLATGSMLIAHSRKARSVYYAVVGFVGLSKPTVESRTIKSFKAHLERAARSRQLSNAGQDRTGATDNPHGGQK